MSIRISAQLSIQDNEVVISAVRSQGAGGQNVNKVSSAIHLRFDIHASSLPEPCKQRLLSLRDQRLSKDGVIVIKAQQYRTREKNLEAAIDRLREMIRQATARVKKRRVSKPTRSSQQKRLDRKNRHGRTKVLRGKVYDETSVKQAIYACLHKTSCPHRLPGYGLLQPTDAAGAQRWMI